MEPLSPDLLDVLCVRDPEAIDWRTGARGKWKMLVLMAREDGAAALFFRINTRNEWRGGVRAGSVLLTQAEHGFLEHDSYLYCGGPPLALTERDLKDAMEGQSIPCRRGVIGRIARSVWTDIRSAVAASDELSERQRKAILAALATLA